MEFAPHPTHRYALWLGIILILAGALFLFNGINSRSPQASAPPGFPENAPAPRPADYVAAQKGFQYLVSYGSNGFLPQALSVIQGETVRFTNNSDSTLNLTLFGTDTASLKRAEYFEYTFSEAGTFSFGDGAYTGIVTVIK